ncbi:MAG: Phosphoglycerate mutase [Myxococcaceae bacterium]|nr:Phosphoglycerate mutase [Myxococcaceae bacterium]
MLTRTLLLVRHGESEGNAGRMFTGHGPSPLTALGERQAEALGAALAPSAPSVIYSSDLPRALSTAAPLAARTGLAVVADHRLRERDMGAFVGVRFEVLEAEQPEAWRALLARDPEFTPPEGESHRRCAARMSAAVDDILARHATGTVVVVSHGVAIHHALRHLLGANDAGLILATENCGVHRLEWREFGVLRVAALNDTSHLVGLLR